ncbi:MAG: insulinase family protein [Paramuribaculum sp.]|nr:insulinase family protein [Paramuribaculum sp.]
MIQSTSFTLDNGLRVVHHADTSTAKVALDLLYNVGARDESPQLTGLAHLFEHLMFGGSENVKDFDRELELAGARNNAWTSSDYTNFYIVVPAVNVETAFWVESDRMLALSLSDKALDVQRNVVVEEFKQTVLNQPYGEVGALLRSLIYKKHPYRWQTIGLTPGHVLAATGDDVRRFFHSHYAPNNAVLAVSGNISLEHTRELAEKWFGSIPPREIATRNYSPEPEITQPRLLTVQGNVPAPLVSIAYLMSGCKDPLFPAADILTDILAGDRSSRFHKELIMKGDLFAEADASVAGTEEPGFLLIDALLTDSADKAVDSALERINAQIKRIVVAPPAAEELERAVNKFESRFILSTNSYLKIAEKLAMAEMQGDNINDILPRYKALTPEDIHLAARQIFVPARACTLIYKPT